ncbi:MAG: hypothetical protein A2288_01125 [Candidatus Moranbacteria bacterium RIFOXYA12_FULL_44_15]|nr:MAG: hypothetical protein A2288_01125 [Candidatus Moranbacteria bacterium RIFOXYA12_FULL_44_15]OGI34780.1 MAG: hypothetical protein A2259_00595 [Candidatus Moranbacteria bacterium RIFOXYA2_FULL_43_15]
MRPGQPKEGGVSCFNLVASPSGWQVCVLRQRPKRPTPTRDPLQTNVGVALCGSGMSALTPNSVCRAPPMIDRPHSPQLVGDIRGASAKGFWILKSPAKSPAARDGGDAYDASRQKQLFFFEQNNFSGGEVSPVDFTHVVIARRFYPLTHRDDGFVGSAELYGYSMSSMAKPRPTPTNLSGVFLFRKTFVITKKDPFLRILFLFEFIFYYIQTHSSMVR